MIFIAALDLLTHEELAEHVANLEVMDYYRTLKENFQKGAKSAQKTLTSAIDKGSDYLAGKMGRVRADHPLSKVATGIVRSATVVGEKARTFDVEKDWQPYEVINEVKARAEELKAKSDEELRQMLLDRISKLAGEKDRTPGDATLIVAAKAMKIDSRLRLPEDVEHEIFIKYAERLIKHLQDRSSRMSADDEAKLEETLREELAKLSKGDSETLSMALKLDELSAQNVVRLLKSGGVTVTALLAADAAGFGLFLFMATLLKAFSLLIGVTFAFSAYMATMSFLGFLISPLGGFLVVSGALGITAALDIKKFKQELLAWEVFSLHCKLLQSGKV